MTTAADTAVRLGLDVAALATATGACPTRIVIRPMPLAMKLLAASWVAAITTPRTIFVRPGVAVTGRLLAHELTHSAQWRRTGAAGFLAGYASGFIRGLARSRSWRRAYESVPAEAEARRVAGMWEV